MRIRFAALPAAFFLLLFFQSQGFSREVGCRDTFSAGECTWAVQWINNGLSLFMERGYIKKISAKDDAFDVYAGKPWYTLDASQQVAFLKNVSRAREITGHSPFFSVFDSETEAVVAKVTAAAIEILLPVEGFMTYAPEPDAEKNTIY